MTLNSFRALLIKVISLATSLLLSLMAVIYMAQVIFRYVIQKPLVWADELSGFLMVWVVFLGAVVALHEKTHINIDILWQVLPFKFKRVLVWTCDILVLFVAIILAAYGYKVIKGSIGMMATSIDIPYAPVYSIIPISGVLMITVLLMSWLAKKK